MIGGGGITFLVAKETLRLVTDNGVRDSDARVMRRCNEATQELMASRKADGTTVVPVGTYATYLVVSSDETILLPMELENAARVRLDSGTFLGQTDVVRGWSQLVDGFAYLDPTMSHDNPLVDQFLQPDPVDPTILRRQYRYPGIQDGTMVVVTGRKRFIPITSDADYLLIQNVPALKLMVQAIERREARNAITESQQYKEEALRLLADEAASHLLDPQNASERKFDYQADLVTYVAGTLAHTRARLALELPGMLMLGKSELNYFVNEAVEEAVKQFNFLGRTERYSLEDGPNQLVFAPALLPADVLVFSDFEILRLLVIAQRTPPTGSSLTTTPATPPQDSTPARQEAFALIERNMAQAAESAREAAHLANLGLYDVGSKGYIVSRIGLEMPGALNYTVNRLGAMVERAEARCMEMGLYKGTIDEFDATIASGNVLFPVQVESVLACAIDGCHVDVRSIFFRYQQAGPGWCDQSSEILEDQGEQLLSNGLRRRSYRVRATVTAQVAPAGQTTTIPTSKIVAVCKLKSIIGRPLTEQMSIRNVTALMGMTDALINNDPQKQAFAKKILDDELSGYLAGVKHTIPFITDGYGFGDLGCERW